jgi:hypothetical protein
VGDGIPTFEILIGGVAHVVQPTDPVFRLRENTWFYLAGVYDGQTITLYVNGFPRGSAAASGAIHSPTRSLSSNELGDNSAAGLFAGMLYDIRIWSEALTPDQIGSNWSPRYATPPVPGDTLRLWYPMSEGAGFVLVDHSGNGNDANILNKGGSYVALGTTGPF